MSTWEIVALVIVGIVVLFFLGGLAGARVRDRQRAVHFDQHVREADEALERAWSADKGWHRETMEAAARDAIAQQRPGWGFEELVLVLVDDHPGTTEDRAHFVASGPDGEATVVIAREGDRWVLERVE